ncbi:hypothetical protein LSAT2_019732 [Lamellibrachia satsuma]|nr:hypothetical protein LSAT2_019732 [Lamellibrachia satsuma]
MSVSAVNTGRPTLFGVNLASETFARDVSKDLRLGVIQAHRACVLAKLRHSMIGHVPDLPEAFSFITTDGRSLTQTQEKEFTISELVDSDTHVIRILKHYGKPRVGVCAEDGTAIGFLYIEKACSLQQLRDELQEQLGVRCDMKCTYQFVDRNGWPVMMNQEHQLCVLDLLNSNASVLVCQHAAEKRTICFDEADSASGVGKLMILISYVRQEAINFAVELKKMLTECGYHVFLDVHDIKAGSDWQDALNDAVSQCHIFVPLVTEKYGKTEWTNRELKLADTLKKQILPVNFLDEWPPDSLAIQFATKHFIEGRLMRDMSSNNSLADSDMDSSCVQTQTVEDVSRQLADIISRKTLPGVNSCTSLSAGSSIGYDPLSQDRSDHPLIVLSFHPYQRKYGKSLQATLKEKGYDVWCSCPPTTDTDMYGIDFSDSPVFDISGEVHTPLSDTGRCFSQSSSQGSQESPDLGSPVAKNAEFRGKADNAELIIFILSKEFAKSKTSRQQVFYCEKRKRVIPVRAEDFCMPSWMSVLIGTNEFLDCQSGSYGDVLCDMVKKALDPDEKDNTTEKIIEASTKKLQSVLPKRLGVYISGSTSFYSKLSKPICVAVGKQLAGMRDIHMGTGGFYGIGEAVGHSFHEERDNMDTPPSIWHVLPYTKKGSSKQARQNRDGTFKKLEYGQTVYSGNSVRQRETIVAKVFDICILLEGGPRAAHEAQEFAWNEHVVIPIKCTGGAAGGKFGVPEEIFKVPPGVNETDWATLSDKKPSPEQLAQSVRNIIEDVQKRLKEDLSTEKEYANLPKTCDQTSAKNIRAASEMFVEENGFDSSPSTRRPKQLSLHTVRKLNHCHSALFSPTALDTDKSSPASTVLGESAKFDPGLPSHLHLSINNPSPVAQWSVSFQVVSI